MLNESLLRVIRLNDELSDIIQGCIKGKRNSQEKLYRMYSAKMFGVCCRYCHDYDEAKDVLQEAFIKVFEKIEQFRNKGSFEGWVRKIIVNTALEKYRKQTRTVQLEHLPELHDEENEEIEFTISMNEMLAIIQKLPDRYRMVFNMYAFENMTHKEISQRLNITEGTSKSDLSRARAILQKKICLKSGAIAKIG
jgi:RNA polymerase sigma factor (sigma-70 family)